MSDIIIENGRTLLGGELIETSVEIAVGRIAEIGRAGRKAAARLDASGLLLLPGIVDIHGDAFERQVMPRPGVGFPHDIALLETDRQMIANGITTAFHGITWSWEPGLRGADNARALIDAIHMLRPQLRTDTRIHLRHETFNLDAEMTIVEWLRRRRIDLLAFNDHMSMTVLDVKRPHKRAQMADRAGLSMAEFDTLVERVASRGDEVPASIEVLAAMSAEAGIPTLSHDDQTVAQRQDFRALGVRIAEFPVNEETAREAASAGEFTVFGAPNVVRGGSHTGWTSAAEMVQKGLCTILASDYYYPAMLLAAFRLAYDGIISLPRAWDLISQAPAMAAGLKDRGRFAPGLRGDAILVDAAEPTRPRVVAVIAGGKLVQLSDASRLTTAQPVVLATAAA